jgi:hypothetical protein
MAATFKFAWTTFYRDSDEITGKYEQEIWGDTLADACEYFESFWGPVGLDDDQRIEITSITAI